MKKLILIALIAYAPITFAEWRPIFTNKDGREWFYDDAKFKSNGAYRDVWILTSQSIPEDYDGKQAKSRINKYEFNCSSDRAKMLYSSIFSGAGGGGSLIDANDFSSKPLIFTIPPNTNLDAAKEFFCKK